MESYLAWRAAAEQEDNEPPDRDFCYNCHNWEYGDCNIDGTSCGLAECPTCRCPCSMDCETNTCYCSDCDCLSPDTVNVHGFGWISITVLGGGGSGTAADGAGGVGGTGKAGFKKN